MNKTYFASLPNKTLNKQFFFKSCSFLYESLKNKRLKKHNLLYDEFIPGNSQFHFLEIFIKIFNVTVEEFFNLFL
jgi:hypothetical protein